MSDFVAVVICEGELHPVTSQTLPKALLPVANRPLLDATLHFVELTLNDILILTPSHHHHAISSYLRSRKSAANISVQDFQPSDHANGISSILLWARDQSYIKGNFVLLPPDLCALPTSSNAALSNLVDAHRRDANLITSLFVERAASNEEAPKKHTKQFITIYDPASTVLLDYKSLHDAQDGVEIRTSLFDRYPHSTLRLDLLPTHVHVCSARVLDLMRAMPRLKFREQFLPLLAKDQWQPGLIDKYEDGKHSAAPTHSQALAYTYSSTLPPTESKHKPARAHAVEASTGSALPLSADLALSDLQQADFRRVIRIWTKADGFCSTTHSMDAYAEINRVLLSTVAASQLDKKSAAPQGPRQVGPDSVVGTNCVLGDKTTIKKSSVASNVNIAKDCKVSNSIIMDGVSIGEDVKLESCIIAPFARIGDGCQLVKCEVTANFDVLAGTTAKGEQFVTKSA